MSSATAIPKTKININESRYDQSTYLGRAKHFFVTTNPLNVFASNNALDEAKQTVEAYKKTGELSNGLTEDKLWNAKYLMDSAFHPDTGEKMVFIGRMSAQVPMNLLITGGMLTWYKTTPAVILWQVINQSFNATVNYTNRSGDTPIPTSTLATSFSIATSAATGTALALNMLVKKMPPIAARFVPFAAVAAANCINLPFMRSTELKEGIQLVDSNDQKVAKSTEAGKSAIAQVIFSRVTMATPGMVLAPIAMNYTEKRFPKVGASLPLTLALQMLYIGTCLVFATPLCCAIFPQKASILVSKIEEPAKSNLIKKGFTDSDLVYFNKGL